MMRPAPVDARGEDALDRIEFGAIRAWLAARTSSERARRMAADLAPADDLAQARERLADLAEAKRLFETHGAWPSPAASALGESLEMARRGRRLDALVLLEVRRLLDAVESTRAYFRKVEDAPRVRAQGEALVPAAELLRERRPSALATAARLGICGTGN